ncbi:ABC transporter substrate-binding protein [Pseudonocardia nigra]|uniref:ABC transporter substrate-binding protein n=1 Tax=Pseudonocardia nigra TaxID=1921578 RepID=UPI001C5EB80F|nr:ABC transporter substrate-binding protein [Pseudonocardia nigra]
MSRRLLGVGAVAAAVLVSGCSGAAPTGFGDSSGGEHSARFVQQPWADLVVETEIAMQVLTELGYSASTQEVAVPLGAEALATGNADAYLGNWWPSQQDVFTEHIETGAVEVVGTVLEGTQYSPAVPGYVVEELGVRSLADLDRHADAFGRKIYGIEPGAPGNETINEAIAQDAYGLGDWELVASSTEAMLAEVSRRAAAGEPIAFLGWSPHWMATEYDLHFLDDPQSVWPGAGEVRSLTRAGLAEGDPNLVRFISQISVDTETASEFIRAVDKDGKPAEQVARDWIQAHPDRIEAWLEGVTSVSGEPAAEVVLAGTGG